MVQVCQNSAGIFCQNGAGLEYFGLHHNLHHTTNASLIIEHSKRVIKQSKDWLFATSDPNLYLRDGISLVNSIRLLCPMHSFVLLLHTVYLDSLTNLLQMLSVTSDKRQNKRLQLWQCLALEHI